MSVNLVSITEPKINSLITNAEDLIVYCARVSNPSNQLNVETSQKLIKYLIDHKHWSPMEQASMCVEIKTSRAISAQILRHRSFSFQEYSQRYSTVNEFENIEWRLQGKNNRQVGDDIVDLNDDIKKDVNSFLESSRELYDRLIDSGIAKECARMILPLNSSSTLYMSGTVRSWIHYIEIRTEKETQKEHREIALKIQNIFKSNFPNISKALNWL